MTRPQFETVETAKPSTPAIPVILLLTRDDGELVGAVLVPGDPLGLLHEEGAEALVLELAGVARAHRDHAAVDVELAHDGDALLQLGPEKRQD